MKSGSHWPHVVRGVAGFIAGGAAFGVIQYAADQGSHHHKTTLLLSIIVGAIAGAISYVRSRSNRAARGLGRQLGASLRTPAPEAPQIQDAGPSQRQPETQGYSETGPRHPG